MAKQFAAFFVVLAVLSGVVGDSAIAQGINPFSKRGGLNFTAADFKLLNQSRDELLAARDGDPVRRWRNPGSGSGGVTTLVQTFTKDGLLCREIRYDIESNGRKRQFIVPYCQVEDGSWKIAF